jgi:hypothetical protein
VIEHPEHRARDVLDGRGERVFAREAVVDVEHGVTGAREHERHHPVRLFAEDAKAAAVHVHDGAPRLLRLPHVELQRAVVGDVARHLNAMPVRSSQRVHTAESRNRVEEPLHREHRELTAELDCDTHGKRGRMVV